MKGLEQLFKGLADPTRLRIVSLLLNGELCVCDVQYVLETPQPNVSRHLQYLKNAGLVTDRRDGYRIFYRLAGAEHPERRSLFEFLRDAFEHEEPFQSDTERLRDAIRHGACTRTQWRPYAALQQTKHGNSART